MNTRRVWIINKFPVYLYFAILSFLLMRESEAQEISYILPDIGSPGMNTYVEIIGRYNLDGNFGADGFYLNVEGDPARVVCENPNDTNKITIGPIVVSWNGKMISTQIFVHPDVRPNSDDWRNLQPEFIIPIRVIIGGNISKSERFYIVRPYPVIVAPTGGTLGDGTFGIRSRRGAMIVDSIALGTGAMSISTSDTDPDAPGGQGFLPFILISKGRITGAGATINASASGKDGGPGGGGGGGNFCDWSGTGSNGGAGFAGGGRGGRNSSGNPLARDEFRDPGESTGLRINNTGESLNGVPGGTAPWYEAAGGGTGHPFGLSGEGCNDGAGCNPVGGYGGGSGQQQTRGGGGGGYATAGESSNAGNGGKLHGNAHLVPLAGGSGGSSGNPQGFTVCSGEGGGGGGAVRLYGTSISDVFISANGGDGQPRSNGPGGSGSGGAISVETKVMYTTGRLNANGGSTGMTGGAGRIRIDGARNTIVVLPTTASTFRGPSTDTLCFVPRTFTLNGTGNGEKIRLYIKSKSIPWELATTVTGYSNNSWSQTLTLPGNDEFYYLAALQEVPSPQSSPYASEPSWVFSQAAANIFIFRPQPVISSRTNIILPRLLCENERVDTVFIRNAGDGVLTIQSSNFSLGNSGFSLIEPSTFPVNVNPRDSIPFLIRFAPIVGQTGLFRDTLVLANNDTSRTRNPWRIALEAKKDSAGLRVFPQSIDFGTLLLCERTTADTIITIENTGTVAISLEPPAISVPEVSIINPPVSAFPIIVDPGKTLQARIRFTAGPAGSAFNGTIMFKTDVSTCERLFTVSVAGGSENASIISDQDISFPPVFCPGESTDTSFVITNTGTVPVNFDNPFFTNARFSIISPPIPFSIRPGEQQSISLRFTPDNANPQSGALQLRGMPCNLQALVNMTGKRDSLNLAAANFDFGLKQPSDFPVERDVIVTNTGMLTVQLWQALFNTGTPFSIISGIPATIPPGGTATLTVRFNDPGVDGSYLDTLVMSYDPSCGPQSIVIRGSRGTAAVTLEAGTAAADAGAIVEIPIYMRGSVNPALFGATGIATNLRFHKNILYPLFTPSGSIVDTDRVIPLILPLTPQTGNVLATLRFRAMLGNVESTDIILEGSTGIGGALTITELPGNFTLTNICREGGTRLYSSEGKTQLKQNHPNPFNPVTEIDYEIIEAGTTRLYVMDRLGRLVTTLVDSYLLPGKYSALFNATGLSSGVYYYVLQTPSQILSRPMIVMQ